MSRALIQEIRLPEARAGWPYEATSVGGVLDKVAFYIVTIGYMLKRDDIVEGVYLKQTNERYGIPEGLIGVVHQVSTDRTGEWVFLLRYLDHPGGTRRKPHSLGSLNLREKDLDDFELIGDWISAQALLESTPSHRKVKNSLNVPVVSPVGLKAKRRRLPAWRKVHPNQLRLFEEY
jgi:hypothetical protein